MVLRAAEIEGGAVADSTFSAKSGVAGQCREIHNSHPKKCWPDYGSDLQMHAKDNKKTTKCSLVSG